MIYYFEYGELVSPDRMKTEIKGAEFIGRGYIKDHRMIFRRRQDLIKCKNEVTYGCLFKVPKDSIYKLKKRSKNYFFTAFTEVEIKVEKSKINKAYTLICRGNFLDPRMAKNLKFNEPVSLHYIDMLDSYTEANLSQKHIDKAVEYTHNLKEN